MAQAVLIPAAEADYLAVGNRVLTTAHTAAEQAEEQSLLMGIGHTLVSVYPAGAVALLVVIAFVVGLLRHDGVDGHLDPDVATTDQELDFR